jgi:2-polyprenyl-3-methyl-5-hydroxy-6-metoxy-1,4-benzoquinol methylase
LDYIFRQKPRQRKKVLPFLERTPEAARALDDVISLYAAFLRSAGLEWKDVADSYLLMNDQMTYARLHFVKTGEYPTADGTDVAQEVYGNRGVMQKYMLGLALSQFLWPHHFACYRFFLNALGRVEKPDRILEIGSGHGLFTVRMLQRFDSFKAYDVVDISSASIDMSKGILRAVVPQRAGGVNFIHRDILDYVPDSPYDFISMSEVLEHVTCPAKLLARLHSMLASGGQLYLNTCANCPAIDHVYRFRDTRHIESLIRDAGFRVEAAAAYASEDVPPEVVEKQKLDTSYVALLRKDAA